jgi:Tfp pilus assembly PilM family ATPase
VDALKEYAGDFGKDAELDAAVRKMAGDLGVGPRDHVVIGLSGKQVHVAELQFKNLADAEMKTALRFEVRKTLPFDIAGATLDYQILDRVDPEKKDRITVMVTVVANALLDRHVRLLDKAGIEPWIVDVLPVAAANAFWAFRKDPDPAAAHVILHFAPEVCTLVLDGAATSFYTRSIYFSAEDMYGAAGASVTALERTRRLDALGDELRRSLSFYGKTYSSVKFGALCFMGNPVENEELRNTIRDKLGLVPDDQPLLARLESQQNTTPGKFDAALALSMRGAENA